MQWKKGTQVLGTSGSAGQQLEMHSCLRLLTSGPSVCVLYSTPRNLKLDSGYLGRNISPPWSSLNFNKGKLRKLEFGHQGEELVGHN